MTNQEVIQAFIALSPLPDPGGGYGRGNTLRVTRTYLNTLVLESQGQTLAIRVLFPDAAPDESPHPANIVYVSTYNGLRSHRDLLLATTLDWNRQGNRRINTTQRPYMSRNMAPSHLLLFEGRPGVYNDVLPEPPPPSSYIATVDTEAAADIDTLLLDVPY